MEIGYILYLHPATKVRFPKSCQQSDQLPKSSIGGNHPDINKVGKWSYVLFKELTTSGSSKESNHYDNQYERASKSQ